jgi:hypothetical protein
MAGIVGVRRVPVSAGGNQCWRALVRAVGLSYRGLRNCSANAALPLIRSRCSVGVRSVTTIVIAIACAAVLVDEFDDRERVTDVE